MVNNPGGSGGGPVDPGDLNPQGSSGSSSIFDRLPDNFITRLFWRTERHLWVENEGVLIVEYIGIDHDGKLAQVNNERHRAEAALGNNTQIANFTTYIQNEQGGTLIAKVTTEDTIDFVTQVAHFNSLPDAQKTAFLGIPNLTFYGNPNWYAGPAGLKVHGEGGPGGKPVQADGDLIYQIIPHLNANLGDGSGVDVVILDTALNPGQENEVRNKLQADSAGGGWLGQNDLMDSLFNSGQTNLEWVLAQPGDGIHEEFELLEDILDGLFSDRKVVRLALSDRQITDHGLFIAGLIHSLAPKANIYVVQVLNEYGLGTYWTILRGLQKVQTLIATHDLKKLVVNCSVVLAATPNLNQFASNTSRYQKDGMVSFRDNPDITPEGLSKGLNEIAEEVAHTDEIDAIFLASAGNDGLTPGLLNISQRSLQPRYPAACPNFTGVGALSSTGSRARYSNVADETAGFVTFGGDIQASVTSAKKTHSRTGILGLYTHDFGGTRNTNGWARWAGTSFATAIISGLIASIATGQSIQDAVTELNNSYPINPNLPPDPNTEQMVVVTQGIVAATPPVIGEDRP